MHITSTRLVLLCLAVVLSIAGVKAQDFDCSLVNTLDPNFQGTYNPDTAVSLARCYLAMDPEKVSIEPIVLARLLRPIADDREQNLIDSLVDRIVKLDTSSLETRLLVNKAIGSAARMRMDYAKALKHFRIAYPLEQEETGQVNILLATAITYMLMDSSSRARVVYREAMAKLKNPDLLNDQDYFSVFNNASTLNSYLGFGGLAMESRRKLIYSPRVSEKNKAKVAYNGLVTIASYRMCDTLRAYSKLILDNLGDVEFVRNDVNLQLLKCAAHEDSIALGIEYYSRFKLLGNRHSQLMKDAYDFEYYSLMGDQAQLKNRLVSLWRDSTERNKQYYTVAFLRGYFRNQEPDVHQIILDYFDTKYRSELIRYKEVIEELEVSQNLQIKEAEALQLEAQVQKEKETRKLQYLLAAALVALLGVSLFALVSSRRKSKELETRNASINTLNQELNHRASNQLGLAYELINDQKRHITDDAAKALLERSESQLMALKTVNGFLSGQTSDKIRLDLVLKSVAEGMQAASPVPFHLQLEQSSVTASANDVVNVALVVNELMNNSIKYAWPQTEEGSAEITIQLANDGSSTRLTYADNGGGDSGVVLGTGQGTSLIDALLSDIDAVLLNANEPSIGYRFGFEWGV